MGLVRKKCFIIVCIILTTPIKSFEIVPYQQYEYVVKMERADIVAYNKRYVSYAKTANFKHYNRTYTVSNYTFELTKSFDNDLQVAVQLYKFASNEYRLFPLALTVSFCDAIKKNNFGCDNLYSCGNLTRCPMVKGPFLICNWAPDYSKFPPHIPTGRYMAEVKLVYFSIEVLQLQAYTSVTSTRKWK